RISLGQSPSASTGNCGAWGSNSRPATVTSSAPSSETSTGIPTLILQRGRVADAHLAAFHHGAHQTHVADEVADFYPFDRLGEMGARHAGSNHLEHCLAHSDALAEVKPAQVDLGRNHDVFAQAARQLAAAAEVAFKPVVAVA